MVSCYRIFAVTSFVLKVRSWSGNNVPIYLYQMDVIFCHSCPVKRGQSLKAQLSLEMSFCLPICLCLSEFKCINYLLWSWRGDRVTEHHCTVCTIVSRGWWWGGAGFDGPQFTPFDRVCQHLWLGSSVVSGLKPDVRQTLLFPQWLSLSYWGLGGIPGFWSRSPECQARSACVPTSMYDTLSQHCNPCHRGTRGACSG